MDTALPGIDPDPFGIGIGLLATIAGGASFLETRRQSQFLQEQQRRQFRAAWFEARRSVIFFKRTIDEFETYVIEESFGRRAFRIGSVRLTVTARRARDLQMLRGHTLVTARRLGDQLDELSNFLGPDDQPAVTHVLGTLGGIGKLPDDYVDLVALARTALALYADLLDRIADREAFEVDISDYDRRP